MKKLTLSLVIVLALTGVGVATYLLFFSPKAQATAVADSYMQALLAGDTERTSQMLSSDNQASLATQAVIQRNYKQTHVTQKGDVFYILYSFTDGGDPSKLRVEASGGEILHVDASSLLGATPDQDETAQAVQDDDSQQTCLTREDLAFIDSRSIYARYIRGATMIFKPDTTEYGAPSSGANLLDRMANFYKKAPDKDYVFELRGYMPTSSDDTNIDNTAKEELFQRRAVKIQKDLTTREVPLDRVLVSEEYNYYLPEQASEVENDLYIDINIVNRCVKATASAS